MMRVLLFEFILFLNYEIAVSRKNEATEKSEENGGTPDGGTSPFLILKQKYTFC